ncbi:MAG: Cellulosome-anchoring protein precursor, partial [Chloroflexota bacterium]
MRSTASIASVIVGVTSLSSTLAHAQSGWYWAPSASYGPCNDGVCSPPPTGLVMQLAVGQLHTIIRNSDGQVICWGRNLEGQCNTPPAATGAIAIAAGGFHSVALLPSGTVLCWGDTAYGQCAVPAGLPGSVAIAAGQDHTAALSALGGVACWGRNQYGQCDVPADLPVADKLAAGSWHTLVRTAGGAVVGWGENGNGQCNAPAKLGAVSAISGGGVHSVALRLDGTVVCWGNNFYGQCNVPVDLGAAIAIAAGSYHTVALQADGTVRCWGYNANGQCNATGSTASQIAAGLLRTVTLGVPSEYPVRVYKNGEPGYTGVSSLQTAIGAYNQAPWIVEAPSMPLQSLVGGGSATLRVVPDIEITTNASLPGWRLDAPRDVRVGGYLQCGAVQAGRNFSTGSTFWGGATVVGNVSIGGDWQSASISSVVGGDLNVSGLLSSSAVTVSGVATIGRYNEIVGITSTYSSNTTPGVVYQSFGGLYLQSNARSPTLIVQAIPQPGGYSWPPYSTRHRLILGGGVTVPDGTGYPTPVFITCTDPQFSNVSPCLEFGPQSVLDIAAGKKITSRGPTTTLIGGLATLRNGSTIETDADLAIGGSMRIPVGNAVSLSVDRVTVADPALSIRAGGELVVEFGSSMQIAAPAKASVTGSLTVDQD